MLPEKKIPWINHPLLELQPLPPNTFCIPHVQHCFIQAGKTAGQFTVLFFLIQDIDGFHQELISPTVVDSELEEERLHGKVWSLEFGV